MPSIHLLSVEVRNKIAAGEVIERPASVVKELIENSLDARGTEIRVDILSGGKRLIRVSDNGIGMDNDDALLCFERHATSKLLEAEDLFEIRSLGFRGEALPAIASVSKVKLTTGLKAAPAGISVGINGGKVTDTRDAAAVGTTVEVRDLFFNTPARRKFLKTNATELFHIMDAVTKAALSYPETGFTLSSDTKETLRFPPASGLRERIMQVYGDEFVKGLIQVSSAGAAVGMEAFVSSTSAFRNSKDHQFLFINQRPVRDPALSHAVYKAYEGILPHDRHPVFFIFLQIDPGRIDFNVHPAKREVRFEDRESVYRFILGALRERIREAHQAYAKPFSEPAYNFPGTSGVYPPSSAAAFSEAGMSAAETPELQYMPQLPSIYLGDTFIAVAGKGGLMLLDHHAAHERVLYEKMLKRTNLPVHQLLFPLQVELSNREYKLILDNKELLGGLGIDIDDFGQNTVVVRSLPDAISGADMRGILADIASALAAGVSPARSAREAVAARLACHSSVRGSTILKPAEVAGLIHDLEQADMPDQCPHGRPTRLFYSLDDLKKMFKRK